MGSDRHFSLPLGDEYCAWSSLLEVKTVSLLPSAQYRWQLPLTFNSIFVLLLLPPLYPFSSHQHYPSHQQPRKHSYTALVNHNNYSIAKHEPNTCTPLSPIHQRMPVWRNKGYIWHPYARDSRRSNRLFSRSSSKPAMFRDYLTRVTKRNPNHRNPRSSVVLSNPYEAMVAGPEPDIEMQPLPRNHLQALEQAFDPDRPVQLDGVALPAPVALAARRSSQFEDIPLVEAGQQRRKSSAADLKKRRTRQRWYICSGVTILVLALAAVLFFNLITPNIRQAVCEDRLNAF